MKMNFEDEEEFYDKEKYEEGEYEKVPIDNFQVQPIEVKKESSNFIISFKNKIKKRCTIVISIFIFLFLFFISKRMIFNIKTKEADTKEINSPNIIPNKNTNDDTTNEKKKEHIQDKNNKESDINYNIIDETKNYFYINQINEKINMKSFSSRELKNPNNIKLIENLEISLDLEYKNFVHLKIKDASKKRWEVPENDVLNSDYLKNKNVSKIPLSKNNSSINTSLFNIELIDNNFSFKLINKENLEFYSFTSLKNFLYSDNYINFESKLTSNNIYGFGERTHDFKLDNKLYTIWPYDCGGTEYDYGTGGMNQYSHQPIGLHKTKYKNLWLGFVFLNTNAQDVIIKTITEDNNKNTYLTHKTIGGIIDYYIIVNNSPEEVVKNIHFLLGIPPLPPYWSLGYHQSRYGYKNFNEFKNVYEKYKELNIPIDTMWIDIDSLNNFEIFTIDRKFKQMPTYVKNNIHKDGGKFVPIVDLGISYENMRNSYVKLGNQLDIFIKSNYTKKPLIGKVWPGKTVFPDFLNPKIETFWFTGLQDYYKLVEYDGIWLDMNEPANLLENSFCVGEVATIQECSKDKNKYNEAFLSYFPGGKRPISHKSINENAIVYGDKTIYDVKPLISYYQTKYTYEFLDKKLKTRPFVLSRSTSIGSGKYTFHWLGDNFSSYGNLKNSISGIFNFNIFGIPFTGSDICGFMDNANKDLCIRWYNLGVFYPFSRNHNFFNVRDQYPWSFGTNYNNNEYDAVSIIKKDINYRYSLLRYMYSQFFLISLNEKAGFFKPLMFEYPEENSSYEDIESKIMFGESFLICAFYDRGEENKKFTLPDDNFNEYPTGKTILDKGDENTMVELSGKLDKIYIFLRGGQIVPYQNVFEKYILNSVKLRNEKVNLIVNPNENRESKGILFFDNDDINTINKKTYYRIDLYFSYNRIVVQFNKNNISRYDYKDNILGIIEIWRANEIFQLNDNEITINLNNDKKIENIKGVYDEENNKIIFDISQNNKVISLFDIKEIIFNNL